MLCFGFSSETKGISLDLAEETIIYQTFRNQGVNIVATVIITAPPDTEKLNLGIYHRAYVKDLSCNCTEKILNSDDFYTQVFSKITLGRAISNKDKRLLSLRPFKEHLGHITPVEESVLAYVPEAHDIVAVANELIQVKKNEYIPFTYHEINISTRKSNKIAIRVSGKIEEPSLSRLIFEDYTRKKRYYPVYGVDYILSEIESRDIPKYLRYCESNNTIDKFVELEEFYISKIFTKKIIPEYYSVVVIDEDTARNLTFVVKVNSGSRNLSQFINDNFLQENALFWFVSNKNSQNFKLHFQGNIPEIDIENKSAEYKHLTHSIY